MNDGFERRRMRQGRQIVSYFPPEPYLELAGVYGQESFLILPHSMVTHELRRFQMLEGRQHLAFSPWGLDQLLNALKNGQIDRARQIDPFGKIRWFYWMWMHAPDAERDPQLVARLRRDIESGALAVFRFQRDVHVSYIRRGDESVLRPPAPAAGPVIGWSDEQKIVAMFKAIPDYLEGAAKAEFEAFLTPENLGVMAAFLVGIGALQAVPGADATVDAMIACLAWWQFGWAGLIAGKEFIEAVIEADRATTQDGIMLAAKLAAAALVSLGITLLLRKITERVHEVKWEKAEPQDGSTPQKAPKSLAKSGSTEAQLRAERIETAKGYYKKTGWPDEQIEDHLNGIDFSKDVSVIDKNPGDEMFQWVNPARGPGNYFSLAGTTPDQLGINGVGRVLQKFVVTQRIQVLQSSAAPIFDTWSEGSPVATGGSGLQWFSADTSAIQPVSEP